MDCADCRDLLPLVPGNELDPAAAAAVAAHVAACDACRREHDRYLFLGGVLGSLREMDDIDCNWERLAARTRSRALGAEDDPAIPRSGWHRLVRWAVAASLLAAGAGLVTAGLVQDRPGPAGMTVAAAVKGEPLRPVSAAETGLFMAGPAAPVRSEPVSDREGSLVNTWSVNWLGLVVHDLPGGGVAVEDAVTGGPAHAAGIRAGDIITACGRIRLADARHLNEIVARVTEGTALVFRVVHDGVERTVTILP
ncbi:MAG: PDZ domain-containing protein [Planctomycetota bacterium]